MTSSPSAASRDADEVVVAALDVPVLVGLVAPAVEAHVLRSLRAAGLDGVRAVHGYVFQQLLDGPCSVGALAADLHVTQQRVSTLVDELVAGGYVVRESRPTDGRVRDIVLTEKGHDVVEVARRSRADLESRLAERVGDLGPVQAALAALLDMTSDLADITSRRVPIPPS